MSVVSVVILVSQTIAKQSDNIVCKMASVTVRKIVMRDSSMWYLLLSRVGVRASYIAELFVHDGGSEGYEGTCVDTTRVRASERCVRVWDTER